MSAVREKFGLKKWKKRDNPEKRHCTFEGYKENYVVLPKEWTGEHLIRRDEIVNELPDAVKASEDMRKLAISLGLADEVYIPSLGDDPEDWNIATVPLPILSWLVEVVFGDFISATLVPKAE